MSDETDIDGLANLAAAIREAGKRAADARAKLQPRLQTPREAPGRGAASKRAARQRKSEK